MSNISKDAHLDGAAIKADTVTCENLIVGNRVIGRLELVAKYEAAKVWSADHAGNMTGFDADWAAVQWPAITARMAK